MFGKKPNTLVYLHLGAFFHTCLGFDKYVREKAQMCGKKTHNYMFANVGHFPHMCGKSHRPAYFPLSYRCPCITSCALWLYTWFFDLFLCTAENLWKFWYSDKRTIPFSINRYFITVALYKYHKYITGILYVADQCLSQFNQKLGNFQCPMAILQQHQSLKHWLKIWH